MSDAHGFTPGQYFTCSLSGWTLTEYIIFCHILWWLFYWFLLLITRQSEEWCCRFLTFFHGFMVSALALHDLYTNKSSMDFYNCPLSEVQKNYLSFMLSYFLFDFFWMHLFGNEAWIIYAHHSSSVFILMKIMVSDIGGVLISCGVAGLEFTNPYLQLRWFLRTHGYLNTPIHTAVELWFFVSFFSIRIIGGTVILYYAEVDPNADIIMKLSSLLIYLISLVLGWQILQYFRKKYLGRRDGRTVTFITSRVSISPYFQRRTLDPPNNDNLQTSSENEQPYQPANKVEFHTPPSTNIPEGVPVGSENENE